MSGGTIRSSLTAAVLLSACPSDDAGFAEPTPTPEPTPDLSRTWGPDDDDDDSPWPPTCASRNPPSSFQWFSPDSPDRCHSNQARTTFDVEFATPIPAPVDGLSAEPAALVLNAAEGEGTEVFLRRSLQSWEGTGASLLRWRPGEANLELLWGTEWGQQPVDLLGFWRPEGALVATRYDDWGFVHLGWDGAEEGLWLTEATQPWPWSVECSVDRTVLADGTAVIADCRQLLDARTGVQLASFDGCGGHLQPSNFAPGAARFIDVDADGGVELVGFDGIFELDGEPLVCWEVGGGPMDPARLQEELWFLGAEGTASLGTLLGKPGLPPVSGPWVAHLPAIADVDDDGESDLFYHFDGEVSRRNPLGQIIWSTRLQPLDPTNTWATAQGSAPILIDAGEDGSPELLLAARSGFVLLDAATGRGLARVPLPDGGTVAALAWADADDDLVPEVLVLLEGDDAFQLAEFTGEPERDTAADWVSRYGPSPERVRNPHGHPSQRADRATWPAGEELANLALTERRVCFDDHDPEEAVVVLLAIASDGPMPDAATLRVTARPENANFIDDDVENRRDWRGYGDPFRAWEVSLPDHEVEPGRYLIELALDRSEYEETRSFALGHTSEGYQFDECSYLDNWVTRDW